MIKKLLKILWRITGSVIIMIGAGILMSRIVNKAPSADLKNADQMYAIIDQGGCLICHGGSEDFCTHITGPYLVRPSAGMLKKPSGMPMHLPNWISCSWICP